jgi:trans-aconitate methyltransferase
MGETEKVEPSLWATYNAAQGERPVRDLALDALEAAGPAAGRLAVDLGCGLGRETDAMLRAGWRVHAVDWEADTEENLLKTTRPEDRDRLTTQISGFAELAELPAAHLVYAGFSIPYIPPATFAGLWGVVSAAVEPGGLFAADLLGVNDSYRAEHEGEYTFWAEDALRELLDGWELVKFDVEEHDRPAFSGPHHWHLFHVIARKA